MLGILPDWKRLIQLWDWLSQCLIIFLLCLHVVICKDVPQTTYGSLDEDWNKLNNSLGIFSQSKTWFKTILHHHSDYHLVHDMHGSLWVQVLTGGIHQLHCVEICTSWYLINDQHLSATVTPFPWITSSLFFHTSFIIWCRVKGIDPAIWMKGLPIRRL